MNLSSVAASPAQRPSKALTSVHVETLIQVLERWPSSQVFPGMNIPPQLNKHRVLHSNCSDRPQQAASHFSP